MKDEETTDKVAGASGPAEVGAIVDCIEAQQTMIEKCGDTHCSAFVSKSFAPSWLTLVLSEPSDMKEISPREELNESLPKGSQAN